MGKVTFKMVTDFAKANGFEAKRTGYDTEVRINIKGGKEETAYYASDNEDAIDTLGRWKHNKESGKHWGM
jgi:hypothetical protein